MFKKFCATLAFVEMLGGCTSTGGFTSISIASVQQAAINACNFRPTADTVLNIFNAAIPGLSTVDAIANAICAAVKPGSASAARYAAPAPSPTIKTPSGVVIPIKGQPATSMPK